MKMKIYKKSGPGADRPETAYPGKLTENQLNTEIARLAALIKTGDAVARDCSRFEECKKSLQEIQRVKQTL